MMLLTTILCSPTFAQPKPKLDQFRKVFNHKGKEPVYVVITARDVKGQEKKEVATTMSSLEDAVATELDLNDKDPKIRKSIQANDSVVFNFEYGNSLENISFNLYSETDLKKYAKRVNIDSIKKYISKNPAVNTKLRATSKGWETKFNNKAKAFTVKKERLMFVHLLYKGGILTYLSDQSFGGVSYLPY
jgi:phage pi2 protein 07